MVNYIDILCDGPPSPDGPRLIEVENPAGQSIAIGEWIDRGDGFFALRIPLANTTIALEEIKLLLTYAPTKKPEQGDYDSSNHGDSFDYGWAFAMWGVRQAIEKALSATSDISK